ncbi:hypothetical protein RND81_05G199800 [Saponaria officinalis]|uniref:Uncharacterized protein n=1 Tax=Saponaria officinalis TaxID=3572 RepID=A0AAW1KUG6_SAPOF
MWFSDDGNLVLSEKDSVAGGGVTDVTLDDVATAFVAASTTERWKMSSDVQLHLYGLYKTMTEGPCSAPSLLNAPPEALLNSSSLSKSNLRHFLLFWISTKFVLFCLTGRKVGCLVVRFDFRSNHSSVPGNNGDVNLVADAVAGAWS